jgi:hypothetical protein
VNKDKLLRGRCVLPLGSDREKNCCPVERILLAGRNGCRERYGISGINLELSEIHTESGALADSIPAFAGMTKTPAKA